MRKLKNRKGETLVETLVSVLILVLIMLMLPVSIVTAARINAGAKKNAGNCSMDRGEQKIATVTLQAENDIPRIVGGVQGYEDNGFFFYEYTD